MLPSFRLAGVAQQEDIVEMDMKNIEHFASEVIKLADMRHGHTAFQVEGFSVFRTNALMFMYAQEDPLQMHRS